ncbi:MAG TPA: response regulator transcription factor [Salinivirgaceae bacterium]|nr:response regulator transcription factor [Salinivirgaceae bacterium]HQA75674.1 response regulator transcription factor [Salinivirgaceae bacterium]
MHRILVVDDEEDICEILQYNLESEGYVVDVANNAKDALHILTDEHKLILLDVMMDEMSGYQMASILRKQHNNDIPIIFLTAKTGENDILTGFNLGADDYISKPFSLKELLARVKVVLKRTSAAAEEKSTENIVVGNLNIDLNTLTVSIKDSPIELTKKEYKILVLLAQSTNNYFSREEILQRVWENDVYVLERSVDVHIARLRKKIRNSNLHIVNKVGFGYSLKVK